MKTIAQFFSELPDYIIALILMAFLMVIYFSYKPVMSFIKSQTATTTSTLVSQSYAPYDGTVVSGSDVISVIGTKATASFTIEVQTLDGQTIDYNKSSYNLTDPTASGYIEPTASFSSTVQRTADTTAYKITFVQKSN